jgi:hypothetical protein
MTHRSNTQQWLINLLLLPAGWSICALVGYGVYWWDMATASPSLNGDPTMNFSHTFDGVIGILLGSFMAFCWLIAWHVMLSRRSKKQSANRVYVRGNRWIQFSPYLCLAAFVLYQFIGYQLNICRRASFVQPVALHTLPLPAGQTLLHAYTSQDTLYLLCTNGRYVAKDTASNLNLLLHDPYLPPNTYHMLPIAQQLDTTALTLYTYTGQKMKVLPTLHPILDSVHRNSMVLDAAGQNTIWHINLFVKSNWQQEVKIQGLPAQEQSIGVKQAVPGKIGNWPVLYGYTTEGTTSYRNGNFPLSGKPHTYYAIFVRQQYLSRENRILSPLYAAIFTPGQVKVYPVPEGKSGMPVTLAVIGRRCYVCYPRGIVYFEW